MIKVGQIVSARDKRFLIESVQEDDFYKVVMGYQLMPESWSSPEISFIEGKLFLAGKQVQGWNHEGLIPRWFILTLEGVHGYWGFDLLDEGGAWVGGKTFDTISEAITFCESEGQKMYLWVEEPQQL